MSVISKTFENIGNEIIKAIFRNKEYTANFNIGDYEGKLIIKVDTVKSRDEKSESGIDIYVAFEFAIFRININIS